MRRVRYSLLSIFFFFILCSCAPTAQPLRQIVSVYATSSAQYWLADLYACATSQAVAVNISANQPDIYLQLGESENPLSSEYKIGEEEILIVVNADSQMQTLSPNDARMLFMRGDSSAQVWIFPPGEDVMRAFEQLVLRGSRVTSAAKVATSVGQMSAALNSDPGAVGILPRHWLTGNLREVFSAGTVPVLAITQQPLQGAAGGLIACLQK